MTKQVGIIFPHEWYVPFTVLSEGERAKMLLAIYEYELYQTQPEFEAPALKLMWAMVQANLDRFSKSYQKRAERGMRGGAPAGNQNAKKPRESDLSDEEREQILRARMAKQALKIRGLD